MSHLLNAEPDSCFSSNSVSHVPANMFGSLDVFDAILLDVFNKMRGTRLDIFNEKSRRFPAI